MVALTKNKNKIIEAGLKIKKKKHECWWPSDIKNWLASKENQPYLQMKVMIYRPK